MLKKTLLWIILLMLLQACTANAGQNNATPALPETGVEDSQPAGEVSAICEPTEPDMLGPFYEPDAPVRDSVGEGYVLEGTVMEAGTCQPVPNAPVEFWLAGPDGEYGDEYRATVIADEEGNYRFESHPPPPYAGRPSHIHIRVNAPGYQELVTQHYPDSGASSAEFDLVLVPEN